MSSLARLLVSGSVCALLLGAGPAPLDEDAEVRAAQAARLQAHYRAVIAELRAADGGPLSPAVAAARARTIDALQAYCDAAIFGENLQYPGARVPHFVDAQGRRCAVAHLLDASGEQALVARIAAQDNHAYVIELADEAPLAAWLARVGLTLAEAARIQIPVPRPLPPVEPKGKEWYAKKNEAPSGASTAAPSAAAGPASTGASGAAARARGGAARTSAADGQLVEPSYTSGAAQDAWWTWWEFNKLRFLAPRPLEDGSPAVVGRYAFGQRVDRFSLGRARAEAQPIFERLLSHADGLVRARAAVALGRSGGRAALAALLPLLEDGQFVVRHAALLGIGATGTMEGAAELLGVVRTGEASSGVAVSPWARQIALVGLGLGRRHGLGTTLDALVRSVADELPPEERADLAPALLAYQALAPAADLQSHALAWLSDAEVETSVRCRAAETLPVSGDPAMLAALTRALGDADVEVRRSAALALGALPHPLVEAALKTASELESEPVARGYALLALGEQGGPDARAFLLKAVREGDTSMRPWAALGLGLSARRDGNEEVRRELREGLGRQANHEVAGAWTLALGLSRDKDALPALLEQAGSAADPRQRMFAALAVALVGDPGTRPALAALLAEEDSPLAVVGLAQALGSFGSYADAEILLATIRDLREPQLQGVLAVALGFHGSQPALDGLQRLVADDSLPAAARAAAVDGLGLLLDRQPGLALAVLGASSNVDALPPWLGHLLATFTL